MATVLCKYCRGDKRVACPGSNTLKALVTMHRSGSTTCGGSTCEACQGTGQLDCPACLGTGLIEMPTFA